MAYLTELIEEEVTEYLVREHYERSGETKNHRNGSYQREFTLKGIGPVDVNVPRDRDGGFTTKVIPKNKQVEEGLIEDLSLMFLTGISTRSLSMLSKRLLGSGISTARRIGKTHFSFTCLGTVFTVAGTARLKLTNFHKVINLIILKKISPKNQEVPLLY